MCRPLPLLLLLCCACEQSVEVARLPGGALELLPDAGTSSTAEDAGKTYVPVDSGSPADASVPPPARDAGLPPVSDAGLPPSPWPRNEPGLPYCQNSFTCGSSQFCKDRGDGVKLCMGDSPPSAYCVSSIDCADGFCRDRGDGLRVCMGEGKHGDYCLGSIDCARGFCKDRGDGVLLCMYEGLQGQFCASSLDCASTLFCRSRFDGLKVCM